MKIEIESVGFVKNSRTEVKDDDWEGITSELVINNSFPEDCLMGIEKYSHLEVIFYFHLADKSKICRAARYPRNNRDWPLTGIFALRGKNRPNHLGLTIVKLIKRVNRSLFVNGLDAVDGSPIIDIKPVIRGFLPIQEISQPQWVDELMKDYWRNKN